MGTLSAGAAAADPGDDLVAAFSIACLDGLADLGGHEGRLAAAGFAREGRSTRVRDGNAYNVGESARDESCSGTAGGTDPVSVGVKMTEALAARGLAVTSATRKGRRTSIGVDAPQGTFEVLVQPAVAGATSVSVFRP